MVFNEIMYLRTFKKDHLNKYLIASILSLFKIKKVIMIQKNK